MVFNENADCIASTHPFCIVFILLSLETVFNSYCFKSFLCRCKVNMQEQFAISMKTT